MRFLLFGMMALLLAFLAGHMFLRADPQALARRARPVGIVVAVIVAVVLMLTGRFALAQRVLAALGMGGAFSSFNSFGTADAYRSAGTRGRRGASRVRTSLLEMELDHLTGEMSGRIVGGRFAGRMIQDLDLDQLAALHRECAAAADQSEAVLGAFLDRLHPDWRNDARFSASGGGESSSRKRGGATSMTREEAYEVLGLEPGASEEEIRRSHKRLMKQYHPDQGGSDYLASKINEAKDVLLRR